MVQAFQKRLMAADVPHDLVQGFEVHQGRVRCKKVVAAVWKST
jgi:hypothetical protein